MKKILLKEHLVNNNSKTPYTTDVKFLTEKVNAKLL